MLLLEDQAWYVGGKVKAILGEERVVYNDQPIGTLVLHYAILNHFRSMLNVVCKIRMQLKIVLELFLDGDHKENVVGDYENFSKWF